MGRPRKEAFSDQELKDAMDPRVSSLNGLHYRDNSYFDFVVAERPMYTPGCGPPLAPISVLPPHDKDGIILEKTFVDKALRYIIGYKEKPHLRHSVKAQDILDWVSPRTFEQWESDEYDRREREEAEIELPKLLAREKAKAKRLEKLSRGDGPHIDGRRKRRKLIQNEDQDQSSTEFEPPRKRGKPGRPRKSSPRSNLQIVLPSSSPMKSPPQVEYKSPRRLSQHSTAGQPSLSTPVRVRGLNEVQVPDSEDQSETDEDSIDVDLALEAQLNGTRDPSADTSSSPSSLMGGAVAKTSSREALAVYESIEKSHANSGKMTLERSPFKKPILPNLTSARQRSASSTPLQSTRSSTRVKSSTPVYTPPQYPEINPDDDIDPLSQDQPEPEPETEDWEVEAILSDSMRLPTGNRGGRKVKHYLIHWKGYPIEDATWEPEKHVGDGAIGNYEREKARKRALEEEVERERGMRIKGLAGFMVGVGGGREYVSPYGYGQHVAEGSGGKLGEGGMWRAPMAQMQRGEVIDDDDEEDDDEVDLL